MISGDDVTGISRNRGFYQEIIAGISTDSDFLLTG